MQHVSERLISANSYQPINQSSSYYLKQISFYRHEDIVSLLLLLCWWVLKTSLTSGKGAWDQGELFLKHEMCVYTGSRESVNASPGFNRTHLDWCSCHVCTCVRVYVCVRVYLSLIRSLKETRPANLSLSLPGARVLELILHSPLMSVFREAFRNFTATSGWV